MRHTIIYVFSFFTMLVSGVATAQPVGCNRDCLQVFADNYRAAYLAHDAGRVVIDDNVRFSENFVEMAFPDGTWHTVSEELGPPLTLLDTQTSQIGIYTVIMQNDIPGFLAVRLKVEGMKSPRSSMSFPPGAISAVPPPPSATMKATGTIR